jgi:hypothetical protein
VGATGAVKAPAMSASVARRSVRMVHLVVADLSRDSPTDE